MRSSTLSWRARYRQVGEHSTIYLLPTYLLPTYLPTYLSTYLSYPHHIVILIISSPQPSLWTHVHHLCTHFYAHTSPGFSIFLQTSYLNVLQPPVDAALQAYFPTILRNYAGKSIWDLAFQQLLFFMSASIGCSSSLAAVPLFAGQLSLLRREASSGISVVMGGCHIRPCTHSIIHSNTHSLTH